MELEGYIPSDVPFYFEHFGQTLTVAVNGISVDGTPVDCGHCDDGEQVLDIDYAISMAPGMDQVQVYVGNDPVGIENQMATDNVSKQLSTSWGYSEDFADEDAIYQEMAAQGQSYFTASGDNSTLIASGPWPEEDANIIAVGGTDLVTDGAAGPWQSEPGWEDSAAGPSVDKTILIESYQLPYINKKNLGLDDAAQRGGHLGQLRLRHGDLQSRRLPGRLGRHELRLSDVGGLQRADQPAGIEEGQADGRLPQSGALHDGEGRQEDAARRHRQQERQVPGREGLRPRGRSGLSEQHQDDQGAGRQVSMRTRSPAEAGGRV